MKDTLTILQLYPRDMNIYGDNGNVQALTRYISQAGLEAKIIAHNPGDQLPETVDIVIGGGGQDSGQEKIHQDLLQNGDRLRAWAEAGVPMLLICGLYQLFGAFFQTADGTKLEGIRVFDAETFATKERLIGNILIRSEEFGELIGYENHSGQTYLHGTTTPLGLVLLGAGNNSSDGVEGARVYNVIGSYLHGSLLPKNPQLTHFLVSTAADRKGIVFSPVEDSPYLADARAAAMQRPR